MRHWARHTKVVCVYIAAWVVISNAAFAATTKKLVTTLPAFADVDPDFRIGPQGSWVAYRADQDQDEMFELFSVDFVGGTARKLNGPLSAGGDVGSWQLTADGSRAIYWANAHGDEMREVFSAVTVGGSGIKLNSPLVRPGSIGGGWANDRAVFIASERESLFGDPFFELFGVPAAGGPVALLSGPLVNGGDVKSVVTRANSDRVLYLADQQTDETVELYSVSAQEGSWVKLNPPLVANRNVLADGLALSPDGSRALYAADQEADERFELYSVPASGGESVKLNGPLVQGGDVTAGSQRFNANGSRVLYHADQDTDEVFEVYSAASVGGQRVKLNGQLALNGDVNSAGLQFSPSGDRVLYSADQNEDEVVELFSVPSSGGTAVKLNGALVVAGDVFDDAMFSPDGNRVIYRADQLTDEVVELFSVPSVGGIATRLNKSLVTSGDVVSAKFSPDGTHVAYLADQDVDEVFELYLVPSAGGVAEKISGVLANGGDVTDWQFSSDGRSLVYRADQDVDEKFELYAVLFDDDLPGDFNGSGVVDAADYTVWRNGLATGAYLPSHYGDWKSNFGRRLGSGGVSSVPEPSSFMIVMVAMAISAFARSAR
jgi:Tol biopolymer transport system component